MSRTRHIQNHLFTGLGMLSVLLVTVALVGILLPILWRGAGAVVFRGTVEFRRIQVEYRGRGNARQFQAEYARAAQARAGLWDLLDRYVWLDPQQLKADADKLFYEDCKKSLLHRTADSVPREQHLSESEARWLERRARDLKDLLVDAYTADTRREALGGLDQMTPFQDNARLMQGLPLARQFLDLAQRYRQTLAAESLGEYRKRYGAAYLELRRLVAKLLGPGPHDPAPASDNDKYGATHWPQAQRLQRAILWYDRYVPQGPGLPNRKEVASRRALFEGTDLVGVFPLVQDHLEEMLLPRWTCYWQFFVDDARPGHGHYYGGVGPEVLGTLYLTLVAIVFALPLGLVAAAYLVECTRGGPAVSVIRMCINTLSGVPSIVFGLFGLAFFVIFLLPKVTGADKPSVLAGGLTLGLLVLPVIIRASEEAIRSVPASYKEAAMGLGASQLRCFLTVTLPAALPGVLTGVILSMSRAAGETAPILFTAAVYSGGGYPPSLLGPAQALPYSSYMIAVGDNLAPEVPHVQFGMVATLVGLVLLMNVVAIWARSRVARRLRGQ